MLLFTFGCLIVLAYLSLNPYPVLLNHYLNPDYDYRHLTDYSRSMSSALVAFLFDYLAVVVLVLLTRMLVVAVALAMAPSACPWAFS